MADKIKHVKSFSFIAPALLGILFGEIVGGAGVVRLIAGLIPLNYIQSCNRRLSVAIKCDVCTNFIASFYASFVENRQSHLEQALH